MKMTIDASFSNGLGDLKWQFIGMIITTILKFVLSIILTMIYKDWICVIVATAVSIIPFIIIEYLKEKYNKEITYEEYLDYLMKIYLNIKDTDIIKRLSLRTKRKD